MKNTQSLQHNYLVLLFGLLLLSSLNISGQTISQEKLNLLSEKHAKSSFPILYELLSIPNDAFYPGDIEKNIRWCEQAFQERDFKTTRIETTTVPLLLAERRNKEAEKTVLIYLQIDGQPVDTSRWFQDDPYKPALKKQNKNGDWEEIPWDRIGNYEDDWRVFARSTADAKGPVSCFLLLWMLLLKSR